jgi:hypothetical protein
MGGVAEWLNAAVCKTADGAVITVRPFEPDRPRICWNFKLRPPN